MLHCRIAKHCLAAKASPAAGLTANTAHVSSQGSKRQQAIPAAYGTHGPTHRLQRKVLQNSTEIGTLPFMGKR